MLCPKCKAENPESSQFCINCGAKLEVSPASPEPTTPPTPQTPLPPTHPVEKPKGSKLIVAIVIVLILGFLAVTVGGAYYFLISKKKPVVPTPSPVAVPPVITSEPSPIPSPVAAIQTVGTEFQGVEASLTKIERGVNMVTARFVFTCTGTPEFNFGTPIRDPLLPVPNVYTLAFAYLIDDASQMKYEVIKDAAGEPLASILKDKDLKKGESVSLYAQFTAPPLTTKTVTISLPMVQPFTGVSLE